MSMQALSDIFLKSWLYLTLCSYQAKYTFQSEPTLCSCLDVKKRLAGSRRKILVYKRTLNRLAKLASLAKCLSVRLWTKWLWFRIHLQSLIFDFSQISARLTVVYLKFKSLWESCRTETLSHQQILIYFYMYKMILGYYIHKQKFTFLFKFLHN